MGPESARWGGPCGKPARALALALGAERTRAAARGRRAGGLVTPLGEAGARRPGGRVREAGSFVSLAREAGNRREARGGRRGRRGTSAGSAGRWRPLRGRRARAGLGGGREVGRGRGRRGLHLRTPGLLPRAGSPGRRATTGWIGYGPPLGLPDRPPERRVAAAPLGPRRAAAPGDGGAEVLLPGEGCARPCRPSRGSPAASCATSRAPRRVRCWGASLHRHPPGMSPPCPCSPAWAEPSAARWVDGGGSPTAAGTSARSPALGIRRGARGWVGAVCFHRVDSCIFVGLSESREGAHSVQAHSLFSLSAGAGSF